MCYGLREWGRRVESGRTMMYPMTRKMAASPMDSTKKRRMPLFLWVELSWSSAMHGGTHTSIAVNHSGVGRMGLRKALLYGTHLAAGTARKVEKPATRSRIAAM